MFPRRRLRFERLDELLMLSASPNDPTKVADDPTIPAIYSSASPGPADSAIVPLADSGDIQAPWLISSSPTQDAQNVFTAVSVTFTFSEPIDPATVTASSVQLLDGDTPVAGAVTYNAAGRTATLTPTAPLANHRTYTGVARGGASGIKDLAGNALAADVTINFTTVAALSTTYSLFDNAGTPEEVDNGDDQPVELGVKIYTTMPGLITGVRFYKSPENTGPHTGSLWTSWGQLLATATFTNETASGWQQVDFPTPVAVIAGATYVASYHTTSGHYSATPSFFTTSSVVNGPLHAWADGGQTNGVYLYGDGGFPTESYESTNYWVDAVISVVPVVDNEPLDAPGIVTASSDLPVEGSFIVRFSESLDLATVTANNIMLLGPGGVPVAAVLNYYDNSPVYDYSHNTKVTVTPTAHLASATNYTVFVRGGAGGIKDAAGHALAADASRTFTSEPPGRPKYSLFSNFSFPEEIDSGDAQPIEVGMKFQATNNGFISAIRYYQAPGNDGTHTAHLWSSSGQLLATTTFTNEDGSGWQEATFATPVAITGGAMYTASYHTTSGHYSRTSDFFAEPVTKGQLTAPENAGVYAYGPASFPTQSFQSTSYWVDVVFSTTAPVDTTVPTVVGFSPTSGATNVATSSTVTVTFSEAMDASTINSTTVRLLDGATPVVASVSYNAATNAATLTPSAALANSTSYTISVTGGASGVKDLAGNPLASTVTSSFTTAAVTPTTFTLFNNTGTPAVIDSGDAQPVELGVKIRADVNGYITGIRFYKAAGNNGTHTAHLWSSAGQLLATATFTSETASGWQEVNFATPVAITAGATYVASYHTTSGRYSYTRNAFGNAVDSGPLHALANGTSSNGVYRYGAGSFPTQSYQSTNYWVDAVFSTTPPVDTTAATIVGFSPTGGATNVATNTAVTVTFSEAMDASTINSTTVQLLDGATPVAASVSYNAATNTAMLTPSAALANSTSYTISVTGGASGVKDLAGNPLASTVTSSFTTAAVTPTTFTLFNNTGTPAVIDSGDAQPVELGVKIRADVNGYITGIRFYKAAGNNGTHTAHLWSSAGQLLATATFAGETAGGWQEVNFATPVTITAGATYVASYHTTSGHYSYTRNAFGNAVDSGPLHALANGTSSNGVYRYGAGGFPTQSYQSTNYWVDAVFSTTPPVDTTAPTVIGFNPTSGATNVATNTAVTVTFSEAMDASTINSTTVQLLDGATPVAASVSYNASTNTATLTPSAALANSTSYSISVTGGASGVKDLAGNPLASTVTSSFTTAAVTPTTFSLFNNTGTPAVIDSGDAQAVELGVKIRADVNGYLTGIRFYKAAGNNGTHTAHLWSSAGQLLATATFTNETASGWQEVAFSTPVAITAGVTYTASYHTTSGRYSYTRNAFGNAVDSGPLHALANGTSSNGVYRYGAGGFPTQSYQSTNYWVDAVFSTV
ncbi:MAG: DUF4082 domain-containing protein [Pirellulales bacterium]